MKRINITKEDEIRSMYIPNYYLNNLKKMCQYDIDLIIKLSVARLDINNGNFMLADLSPYFYLLIEKKTLNTELNGSTTIKLKFYNCKTLNKIKK